jgi:hypothetical protein
MKISLKYASILQNIACKVSMQEKMRARRWHVGKNAGWRGGINGEKNS